ncbi:MAG: M23 family metallopeptidase [Verrucomicrobiae bacterium]|nr:M23 family metallopeptidase [Verrucomicrobiae bacterium]NNJ42210.1 M23 family metallopeptidase [Akkermansiaceae bacterium]
MKSITRPVIALLTIVVLLMGLPAMGATPEPISLPTDNDHLYRGGGAPFYMFVHRNFEGQASRPWTAGKYGFVRNLKRTKDGLIGTKFHEGIDIKPMKRDRSGKPLDDVLAIASGVIAYANTSSKRSNYGKYVVVEHLWDCGPVYSLYAHLSDIKVNVGQKISQGQSIGKLGYTGVGLSRERAHLHLELNLLLSTRFPVWHDKHFTSKNYHGKHNGINMVGLDIAEFYMAQQRKQSLTLPDFINSTPAHYKVTVPRQGPLEILTRYPWLARGDHQSRTPSWEISFSASGFPLAINPSNRTVTAPCISSIRKCRSRHEYRTKGFVSGTGGRATLSQTGTRFIELLTGNF